MSELEPPLEVEGLGHAFARQPVLRGVDLRLDPGHVLAVLGPSGGGKTTLLRAVAGLVTPREGRIRIAGREVVADGRERVPAERRRVGLVFQDYALFGHMTVRENVAFGLGRGGEARVETLLALTGLEELGGRRPGQLSGGQQQRVALARALAPRPHLLLLDEPLANVDALLRRHLTEELRALLAAEGTSAVVVTHDPGDALALADRLAVLLPGPDGARLAQHDTAEAVYRRPQDATVARLLGPAALVPGEAAGGSARTALGEVALLEPRQGPVSVVLRPEQVRFVPGAGGSAAVTGRIFLGRAVRLACRTPAGELDVEEGAGDPSAPVGARGDVRVVGPCWALPA